MRRVIQSLLLIAGLILARSACSELVLIVNRDNSIDRLSRKEAVDLYMGAWTTLPNGRTFLPLDLPSDSPTRAAFYDALVGMTVPQVTSYWARLLFSGRQTPPRVLSSSGAIIETVAGNRDAIGYVDARDLDTRVKVVLELELE